MIHTRTLETEIGYGLSPIDRLAKQHVRWIRVLVRVFPSAPSNGRWRRKRRRISQRPVCGPKRYFEA
jgi:hypothetical protein